ncbi:uncharacterized protein LW93_8842 [Fusarium fujikuroi]|nr:uncharacterized protein LW93_8842 [Fusarium fujikuroi]SCV34532.1 uncharacterized protein FFB14_04999 [Fusarium fujikuroi]
MVKNKPRLYVVCFFRAPQEGGNPDPYHWGLASGPKDGGMDGMLLYHVRNIPTSQGIHWQFEEPPRDLFERSHPCDAHIHSRGQDRKLTAPGGGH